MVMTKFQKVLAELYACQTVRDEVANYRGNFDTVWKSDLATQENISWLYSKLLSRVARKSREGIDDCLEPWCTACRSNRPEIVTFLAAQSWKFHRICLKAAIEAFELREP